MRAGRVGEGEVAPELISCYPPYIWNMKRHVTTVAIDSESVQMPEMVTRKKLMGGKYATVSTLKLAPGEKRTDPVAELLRIRDEIVRQEAAKAARKAKDSPRRKAA